MRQFGSTLFDIARALSVTRDGSVVVAGSAGSNLPGQVSAGQLDIIVRKYDRDGNEAWTLQMGSPLSEQANGMALSGSGAIYVVGQTDGALPGQTSSGAADAFLLEIAE